MKTVFSFISFFFLCSFFSCKEKTNEHSLSKIYSLIEQHPDSALTLLTQSYPLEELSIDMHMQYLLYETIAKDKSNLDISKDTAITLVSKYYIDKGANAKTANALFYSGRVYMERNNSKKAMECFLKATEYINDKLPQNFNLLGLINYYQGDLYSDQGNYEKTIDYYQNSQSYFFKAHNFQNENYATVALASIYNLTENYDLAISCCQKTLRYAYENNDSLCISEVLKKLGSNYKGMENMQKAKEYFLQAMQIKTSPDDMLSKCLFLSESYLLSKQPDSAHYYIQSYQQELNNSSDFIIKAKYYKYLEEEDELQNDFKKALVDMHLSQIYLDSALVKTKENSVLEITEKYNVEKIQKDYNHLSSVKNFILFIIIFLFFSGGTIFLIMKKETRKIKRKLREKEKKEIEDEERRERIKKLLKQQFEISKKLAVISSLNDEKEKKLLTKINEIIYGNSESDYNWDEFYLLLNELHPNLSIKLQQAYPQLTPEDIHFCCLIKAGFEMEDICFILNFVKNTVRMKKTAIRKKLGITDGGDLNIFLDDFLQKYKS